MFSCIDDTLLRLMPSTTLLALDLSLSATVTSVDFISSAMSRTAMEPMFPEPSASTFMNDGSRRIMIKDFR